MPLHPTPARRTAGLRPAPHACAADGRAPPCTPRLRGERQGSALHPLGLSPQTPEMLSHLFLARGRDGGWGFCTSFALSDQPAIMTAGWSVYVRAKVFFSDKAQENAAGNMIPAAFFYVFVFGGCL
ncbi:hypothetical protein D3Z52_16250 [Clostridiaceae bacterium]|nr:hypothetical protein [Clostridiaceae bacterium]